MDFKDIISNIFEAIVDNDGKNVSAVDLDSDNPLMDIEEPAVNKTLTPDRLTALKNIRAANINNNLTDVATTARKNVHQYLTGQSSKAEAEQAVGKVATVAGAINKVVGMSDIDKVPKSVAPKIFDDEDPDEGYDEILQKEMGNIGRELKKKDVRSLYAKAKKWDDLQDKHGTNEKTVDLGDLDNATSKPQITPKPATSVGHKFDGTPFKDEADKEAYQRDMDDFGPNRQKTGTANKIKDKFRSWLKRESIDEEFNDIVFGAAE